MPDRSPRDVVVAIDQGTSSTKALAIDATGAVVGRGSVPISIEHPRPGWVQQMQACTSGTAPARISPYLASVGPALGAPSRPSISV